MACKSWLDTSPGEVSTWSPVGSRYTIRGSNGLLTASSATLFLDSSTGSREVRRWFLAYEAVKGRSMGVFVVSLGGTGRRPLYHMQRSNWRSGVEAWDIMQEGFECVKDFEKSALFYC